MKIGFIADSHDNCTAVNRMLEIFRQIEIQAVIHAGDYVAPFAVKKFLAQSWDFCGVFGNNDGEKDGIGGLTDVITEGPTVFTIDGIRFGVVHDREDWDDRECDVLVFGHTHKCFYKQHEDYLEVNPGELGGWLSGKSTAAIYDTETADVEIIEI